VNYLGDNKPIKEYDNWDLIEVSKVNDKIIRKLLNYLKYDITDNFFISFESLLKLGNKIPESTIKKLISESEKSHEFKKELLQFILNFAEDGLIKYHLLPELYNPDFIIRAKAVMKIAENDDIKYIKFLLPLIEDPDDSVRWSVIKFLSKHKKNSEIRFELKEHLNKELNPIIYNNLKQIIESQ
jgi:HEAT repeat protein